MTGYHYTSLENWNKIRRQGLKRYTIRKEELSPYGLNPCFGVWLWSKELRGEEHIGEIIYHVAKKATTKIVYFKVEYYNFELLTARGYPEFSHVSLTHGGYIGNWQFHNFQDSQSAIITNVDLPPDRIELIRIYDLMDLDK